MPDYQLNFSKPAALQFARAKATQIADNLAEFAEFEARLLIADPYPGEPLPHSPSSPPVNFPPYKRTGDLQDSVQTEESTDANGTTLRVGTDLERGRYLEFGFFHVNAQKYVGPYPWLRPTFDRLRQEWKQHI